MGGLLSAKASFRFDELYRLLLRKEPEAFLAPFKTGEGVVEYKLMSEEAVFRYIQLCRSLGILEDGENLSLTAVGKKMFRQDGARFNTELFELVKRAWAAYSVTIGDLEDIIGERLRTSSIPSAEGIWLDMFLRNKLRMNKYVFRILLDLTGEIGALHSSADRTFFMAGAHELSD